MDALDSRERTVSSGGGRDTSPDKIDYLSGGRISATPTTPNKEDILLSGVQEDIFITSKSYLLRKYFNGITLLHLLSQPVSREYFL